MAKGERGICTEEGFIQPSSDACKKPKDSGLAIENLHDQLVPTRRHFNGARAFEAAQRAYDGGPSILDRVDRFN